MQGSKKSKTKGIVDDIGEELVKPEGGDVKFLIFTVLGISNLRSPKAELKGLTSLLLDDGMNAFSSHQDVCLTF